MTLDLTDEEARSFAIPLRHMINDDPYPLSPRLAPFKAVLAKLDSQKPRPEPPPPLKAYDAPRTGRGRRE